MDAGPSRNGYSEVNLPCYRLIGQR